MPAPSGNRIARIDGAGVIRVVDLDNAVTMYASEPGTRLQAWAAHGEALYYFSWSDELFRWEPGRAPESLALPIGAVSGFFANSRGSAYLVVGEYAQSGGGAERGLWLVDAVGGTPRRIDGIDADTLSAESPPHWSPDGAYLLLVDTSGSLRLVDTAAAETLVVLPLGREAPTAWNHDGSRFAYVRVNAQGNEELQLFDVTTGMDANLQTYSQPITAIASSPAANGLPPRCSGSGSRCSRPRRTSCSSAIPAGPARRSRSICGTAASSCAILPRTVLPTSCASASAPMPITIG